MPLKNTFTPAFLFLFLFPILLLSLSCEEKEPPCTSGLDLECNNRDWKNSLYLLPYPKGQVYRVNQANNNICGGHQGAYKYGYDFDIPIGAFITASRGGEVSEVRNDNPNGVNLVLGNENLVKILHEDGTTAAYSHLQMGSVQVSVGDQVAASDTLGRSGNSGYTGNFPHLHFHVSTCDEPTIPGCRTVLVNFRNTRENACGLIQNEYYDAL